jgi:hypothetical protein
MKEHLHIERIIKAKAHKEGVKKTEQAIYR